MQAFALRPCSLNPVANVRQVCDCNRAAGAFGASHNLLGNAVAGFLAPQALRLV
jgi:hypothetical protein